MSLKINPNDIVGNVYNEILVNNYIGIKFSGGRNRHYYQCTCIHKDINNNNICGKILILERYNATNNINCGSHNGIENPNDIIGNIYGFLRVDKYLGKNNNKMHYYQCTCIHQNLDGDICGNIINVGRYMLFNGHTSSCGCINRINPNDIVGNTYGFLEVTSYIGKHKKENGNSYHMYNCICKNIINGKICGKNICIDRANLKSGRIISCGCYKSMISSERLSLENPFDIIGEKFGHLKVLRYIGKETGRHLYECQCLNILKNGSICNKVTIVERYHLISGHTTSCGCYSSEKAITHGLSNHILYPIWIGMISRCYNINNISYSDYGGRGIKVCDRWNDNLCGIQNFIDDMYESYIQFTIDNPNITPSLDRIEVNGNYEPSNCRWATPIMQAYNKRTTSYFIYNNQKYTINDLLQNLCDPGMTYSCISTRLKNNKFCKDGVIINTDIFKINIGG